MPNAAAVPLEPVVELVPLKRLQEWPDNPRKIFRDIEGLADSIRVKGVLIPLIVRPKGNGYEIAAGARRYRAAQLVGGLERVPCIIRPLTDEEMLDVAINENGQRADVHPLEEADSYRMAQERFRREVPEIAAKAGKSESYVRARLRLCNLAGPARKALLDEEIYLSVALLLARFGEAQQVEGLGAIRQRSVDGPVSSVTALRILRNVLMLDLDRAPFDTRDVHLIYSAGACPQCPKRSGAQPDLLGELGKGEKNVCLDKACYTAKVGANVAKLRAEAEALGSEVLEGKAADKALTHGSAYVRLDETCWEDPKHRKYSQLVNKKGAPPVVVAISSWGIPTRLVARAELQRALKQAGHEFASPKRGAADRSNDATRERQEKAKRRRAVVREAMEQIAVAHKDGLIRDDDFWRLFIRALTQWASTDAMRDVAQRRGLEGKRGFVWLLVDHASRLEGAELECLALEIVVARDAAGGVWSNGYSVTFRAVAKAYGVDLKKLEAVGAAGVKSSGKKKRSAAGVAA